MLWYKQMSNTNARVLSISRPNGMMKDVRYLHFPKSCITEQNVKIMQMKVSQK